jgi:hypothetical protein
MVINLVGRTEVRVVRGGVHWLNDYNALLPAAEILFRNALAFLSVSMSPFTNVLYHTLSFGYN